MGQRGALHARLVEQGARVLVLTSDLMLGVRVQDSARPAGYAVRLAGTPAELKRELASWGPSLVLVDLAAASFPAEATLAELRRDAPAATILAFYPHVRGDLAADARRAGCDLLMPRSRLLSDLPAALAAGLAARSAPQNGIPS